MTGRLTPVMRLKMICNDSYHTFLAKIAFEKSSNIVSLVIYPKLMEFRTEIDLTKKEKNQLELGNVIRKRIDNKGITEMSYLQIDKDVNVLISIATKKVYIPSSIYGYELSEKDRDFIKRGKILEFKNKYCIGVDLSEMAGIRCCEGNIEKWNENKKIEEDLTKLCEIGYWDTLKDCWVNIKDSEIII